MMRHIKKSTAILLALFLYITATAAYFLPRNADISEAEKWVAVGVSYAILFMNLLVPYINRLTRNQPLGGGKQK